MSGKFIESEADTTYNFKANTIMFWVARTTPLLVATYAVTVLLDMVKPSMFFSWASLILVIIAMTIVAFFQKNTFYQPPMQQFAFYLAALSTIVFIMGFEFVVLAWGIISVSTYLNYDKKAYFLSYVILFAFAIMDILLLWPIMGIQRLYFIALYFIFTFWGTTILVLVVEAQTLDHKRMIRARRRESLQMSRMRALIDGLSDAIINFDNKGVIRLYNSAALNLLDTNKSLAGQDIDDVVKLYNKGAIKKTRSSLFQLASSENKQLETEDFMHRFDDGEEIRLNIVSAPIRNSYGKDNATKEGYILILRDITKVKSLEEERDEFISVISHELRTPITITEGTVSNMMVMAQRDKADEAIVKGLGETHDQIVYLAKMINDLSALSRAERGIGLEKEEINIDEFAHNLYRQYSVQTKNAGLNMDLDIAGKIGEIYTNKLYLEEILQNLITNAIKYTAKGTVTLKVKKTDGGLLFSVTDTGHGISKSDQKKVFQKFYRSEDYRTRETGGTGLGLYVAGKLSNKLGARIKLESRLNHGSTFSFVLRDQDVIS